MRPIDADAFKKYIDAQEGRLFIGCTFGEAMKILIDEQPTIQPEKAQLSQQGTTFDQHVATDTNVGNNSEIPNSSDAVSRQAALEKVRTMQAYKLFEDIILVDKAEVQTELMMLPSLPTEPQWIPVSERVPEDMQFVLLTVRRLKNGYNHEPFISVGYIGWNHQHWWCAHDGDCEISKVEVIAWMPIPSPYQKGATT